MIFQRWIPGSIRPHLQRMYVDPAFSGARRIVLDRLMQDPQMEHVFRELLRFDRKTGSYYHAAQSRQPRHSADEAQLEAIVELLELVVCAATDRVAVTTFEEVSEKKQFWKGEAAWFRQIAQDFKRPAVLGALAIDGSPSAAEALEDLERLTRVADRLERFTTVMRRPDDLLVVDKHRGDPVVRAVQILISDKMERLFGKRLDGTAATLTGAALATKASPRASRSALTSQRLRKRRAST